MSSSSETHCLDASLVVRYVAPVPVNAVQELWNEWTADEPRIVAPTLLWYEVTNALHQWVRHGTMIPGSIGTVLARTRALPIELYGDPALHERALELAGELSLAAAYDAHYLAVAERFGAPLWTADAKLARAVGGRGPRIMLLE